MLDFRAKALGRQVMLNESERRRMNLQIEHLSHSNFFTRYDAVRSLLSAPHNKAYQDAFREAQGIKPLVAMLKSWDDYAHNAAAEVLSSLALNNPANQNAIREAQGITAIITNQVYTSTSKSSAAALWALASNNKTNQDAIREANGIDCLAEMLPNTSLFLNFVKFMLGIYDLEKHRTAAGALWALASNNPSNQAAIINCGALPRLAKLAPTDENAQKTLEACQALQTSSNKEIKTDSAKKSTPIKTISLDPANTSSESFKPTALPSRLIEAKPRPVHSAYARSSIPSSPLSPLLGITGMTSRSSKDEEIESLRQQLAKAKLAAPSPSFAPTIPSAALDINYAKKLGEGGFGVVYQGQWQMVPVAIKQLKATRLNSEALADFQEEAQRHGLLRHPNIVMLFGVCVETGHYAMVMEFMSGGSLYGFLHSSQDIPWSLRKSIAENISSGLYYLHDHQIIHRDLKSLNVLLDDRGQAKLADFGLAALKSETQSTTTTAAKPTGTVRWMAPELFKRGGKCTESSDIYALGWVLWEIAARKIPFEDEQQANDAVIMDWIKEGERDSIPADTPPQYAALLSRCWQQRAEDRPANIKQITDDLSALTIREPANLASGYRYFSSL